jgi:WD40 repeat protein
MPPQEEGASRDHHDAIMNIMMMLPTEELPKLRKDFDASPDGLKLHQFVRAMTHRLIHDGDVDMNSLVSDLEQLYQEVDVNGDGLMQWDEFTSFVIEAGMVSGKSTASMEQKYTEKENFHDSSHMARHIRYFPDLKQLAVCEGENNTVKFYDPYTFVNEGGKSSMQLLRELKAVLATKSVSGEEAPMDNPMAKSRVTDIEFLANQELFAITVDDLSISLWNSGAILTAPAHAGSTAGQRPVKRVFATTPQTMLRWHKSTNTLYTAGPASHVTAWRVLRKKEEKEIEFSMVTKLSKHRGMITDMLVVPEEGVGGGNSGYLVTCSVDKHIYIWSLETNECKGVRSGHHTGVRSLTYGGNNLLLSCSFEFEILAWDLAGLSNRPLFRLMGHRSPLFSVVSLPNRDFAVSLDTSGMFRWWDVRRSATVEDSERCLSMFRSTTSLSSFRPEAMCALPDTCSIVATGSRMLYFDLIWIKQALYTSVACVYNRSDLSFVTSADRDIRVWDACTGELRDTFHNISRSQITKFCLDSRQRKVIVVNQGGDVDVHNYLNGSHVRMMEKHKNEVACIEYCEEDKCIITSSWDRELRVYNDMEHMHLNPMRRVAFAHRADITTMAFSHTLSLVATGAQDGSLKIWDYAYLSQDGCCRRQWNSGEVTAMAFVDPYPLLVTGDNDSMITLWPMRPWALKGKWARFEQVLRIRNMCHLEHEETSIPAPITCMTVFYDETGGPELVPGVKETATGRHLLLTGDELGMVKMWDLTPVLIELGMSAISEEDMPSNQSNYNPHRRCEKDARIHGHKETKGSMYWDVPEAVQDLEDFRLKAAEARQTKAQASMSRKMSAAELQGIVSDMADTSTADIKGQSQELDFRREMHEWDLELINKQFAKEELRRQEKLLEEHVERQEMTEKKLKDGGATRSEKREALLELEVKDEKEVRRVKALLNREKGFQVKELTKQFTAEMKEEKKIERKKRLAARKKGRSYGKPEKMLERTKMPLVLEWVAHLNSAVRSIQYVDDPDFNYKWVVTTGEDKSSVVWRMQDSSYVEEEEEAEEQTEEQAEEDSEKGKKAGVLTEDADGQGEGDEGDEDSEDDEEGDEEEGDYDDEEQQEEEVQAKKEAKVQANKAAAEKAKKEENAKKETEKAKKEAEENAKQEGGDAGAVAAPGPAKVLTDEEKAAAIEAARIPVTALVRREQAKLKKQSGVLEEGEVRAVKIGEMKAGSKVQVRDWKLSANMAARRRRQLHAAEDLRGELVAEEAAELLALEEEKKKKNKLRVMQDRKRSRLMSMSDMTDARAAASAASQEEGNEEGEAGEAGEGQSDDLLRGLMQDDEPFEEPKEARLMATIASLRQQELDYRRKQHEEERRLLDEAEEGGGVGAVEDQLHQRGFRRCPAGVKRKLGREKLAGPPNEERNRLLRQLGGRTTWIETQHEIATKEAATKAGRVKERSEKLAKRRARRGKGKKVFDPYNVLGNGVTDDSKKSDDANMLDDVNSEKKSDSGAGGLSLPDLVQAGKGGKHKDLDQKQIQAEDNWAMGSFNRAREMYWHLSSEQQRMAEKLEARSKKQNSMQPSDFLKKHLGKYANGTPQKDTRRSIQRKDTGASAGGSTARSSAGRQRQDAARSGGISTSASAPDLSFGDMGGRKKKQQQPSAEEAIANFVTRNRPAILSAGPNAFKSGRNLGAGRSESVTTLGHQTVHGHHHTSYRHSGNELTAAEDFRLRKRVRWLSGQASFGKYRRDTVSAVKESIDAALLAQNVQGSHEIDDDIDLQAFLDNGGGDVCGAGLLRELKEQIMAARGKYVGVAADQLLNLIFSDADPKVIRIIRMCSKF